MNNPFIEEVRAARAARAEALDYDPHKIAAWARNAHAERQRMLQSKTLDKKVPMAAAGASDQIEQEAAAPCSNVDF